MNIYLVTRSDTVDYDQHDSHVVVAGDPTLAQRLCETESQKRGLGSRQLEPRGCWFKAKVVKLGNATRHRKAQIINSSFNAG